MDPGIRALLPGYRRIAGTAVTVRCYGADTAIVHYALGKLRPGDVLVLDRAGDTRHAACGGGVAFAAREAGCVGIIIDGPATDVQEIREYDMPVWSRGLSTITGKRQFEHGEFCIAVSCGGVAVEPGDAILADENGVLVMKPHEIAAAAERAVAMQQAEQTTLARLTQRREAAGLQRHEPAHRRNHCSRQCERARVTQGHAPHYRREATAGSTTLILWSWWS